MLEVLRADRQDLEHLEALGEVADCLQIRRALDGSLAGLLPVCNGLQLKARLGIMMRQQFRLGLSSFGRPFRQDLRNALVIR